MGKHKISLYTTLHWSSLACGKEICEPWMKKYFAFMFDAISKSHVDHKERGFLIVKLENFVERSRMKLGTTGQVTLSMKEIADLIVPGTAIFSFHTHVGEGHSRPSSRDKETALSLGEKYTAIGYFKNGRPHISVWRIYEKLSMEKKCIGYRLIAKIKRNSGS